MRRLLICGALLGLTAAGCAATNQPSAPVSTTGSAPSPSPTTSGTASGGGDLNAKLIALSDLPAGYAAGRPSSPHDEKYPPGCEFLNSPPHDGPVAEMNFAAPEKMSLVAEIIGRSSEAKARAVLVRARAQSTTCRSYKSDDGTVLLSAVAQPRLGDDAVAFRMSASGDSTAMIGELVLIRSGALSAYVVNLGPKVDTELTQRLARIAAAKLTR